MKRFNNRKNNELREIKIVNQFNKYAEGSVLISFGDTKIICNATVKEDVPPFLKGAKSGWITAEYSMIPRSTMKRTDRESVRGRMSGRTQEIQRLIGRALRSVINLNLLGERTILIDCDVIQADGGTRTASITGGFMALVQSIAFLKEKKLIDKDPIRDFVAAVSVGIVNGEKLLDLSYEEDSIAEVDMNVVMTSKGRFIEIQGTAEKNPFTYKDLSGFITLGKKGIMDLIKKQKESLECLKK